MNDRPAKVLPIAIYLPQFHPIPENDKWWGKGFTEWTNVAKAKPLFKGHYQPHLPADLGFYDLRLIENLEEQARLASVHGIYGFCYYHYWFNGKLLLETPLHDMLRTGRPDFPFMLCWANENWTRRWDGRENEVLMEQSYSEEDDEKHIEYLIPFFKDPRYIKVKGKCVFIIYKHFLLPDSSAFVNRIKRIASRHGVDLYLCHMVFSYHQPNNELLSGFDAAIDFEPFGIRRTDIFKQVKIERANNLSLLQKALIKGYKALGQKKPLFSAQLNKIPYQWIVEHLKSLNEFKGTIFPSIVPGWDNTARRGNGALILENASPKLFEEWLQKIIADFVPYSDDESFLFINAWNEWAEGNHLEPCRKWGKAYLEVTKRMFTKEPCR